jgi:hypothetical protein
LTAFSQTDTNNQPTKCFPIPVVKLIIKDLMSGDSAKAQLRLVGDQLLETEKKVELKDSVISLLRVKESNYNVIIDAQNQKYSTLDAHTKKVEWDLKRQKVKNKFTSVLSGVAVVALTFFLIIK